MPVAEEVVVPTADAVVVPLVAALVVEASAVDVADVDVADVAVAAVAVVPLTNEVVVLADAMVVEPLAVVALATDEAALLTAVLLAVAEDCAKAGTGVTVGGVDAPVAPALQAASKATPLSAPSWANSCKQRRRSSCDKADGREDIAGSLTKRLLTTRSWRQETVPAGGRRLQTT